MLNSKLPQNIHLVIIILFTLLWICFDITACYEFVSRILGHRIDGISIVYQFITGGKLIDELAPIYRGLGLAFLLLSSIYSMLFWIKFYKKKTGKEFLFMKGLLKWYIGSIVIFGTWSLFCIYVIYPHFS